MRTRIIHIRRFVVFSLLAFVCLCLGHDVAQGQTGSQNSDYVCVQRGPNSRVWQRSVVSTNAAGIMRTNLHSYTELATGICYLQNGQYVDSVEKIEPTGSGAKATQGRYQVQWAANANTRGAVTLTTADNKTLQSTVFGLLYYDSASGSNVLLGRLQDCTGTIDANTLTYSNAFNNLAADIVYVYGKAGLSQDVVLQQQPPSPAAFGLDPATTYLQVMTEFFNTPEPVATAAAHSEEPDAAVLDFGDMKMGRGHAFLFQTNSADGTTVLKRWTNIDNRAFLIESVPYISISNSLSTLHASVISPDKNRIRRSVSIDPLWPRHGKLAAPPVKIAQSPRAKTGFVIDYELLSSTNSLTLQGDTTYFVDGTVVVTGPLTIEGGTVVKYTNANVCIRPYTVTCETSEYRPGVFTSMNDNSVGETITGSTGEPAPYGGAFCIEVYDSPPLVFQHLRFSYAQQGIIMNGYFSTNTVGLWDCQFIGCQYGMNTSGTYSNGYLFQLYNVLFSGTRLGLAGPGSGYYFNVSAINVTADNGWYVIYNTGTNISYATNCLFTGIGSLAGINLVDCATNASAGAFYQTVGAGGYYLTNGSTNRAAGTTDIDSNLLADLQTKTTYPPVVTPSGWFTNDYTFSPQAQRDNSGSAVDLGYHYDPIDYAISIAISNATATVLPGTALAAIDEYGAWLYSSATFNSTGTATSPNYFVRYNTVQEQSNTNWENTFPSYWAGTLYANPIDFTVCTTGSRFTEWTVLGQDAEFSADYTSGLAPVEFQDCQFYGGSFSVQDPSLLVTNCLFQRVDADVADFNDNAPTTNFVFNSLFVDGELAIRHWDVGIWTFQDNLFDQTSVTEIDSTIDICSNNAYVTTNFGILLPSNDDVILTNSPAYETGALGDYYYPTSQTNLIHQGSRLASAAGLYHYTVTTNNVIEGTNQVSIGFHYVATDANGVPLDTTGDGLPDYVKDGNGDGVYDSGDFANWLSPFNVYQVGTSILGYTITQGQLGYWDFSSSGLTNQAGIGPTSTNEIVLVADWAGDAVSMTNTNGSGSALIYPVTGDGQNFINVSNGTICFWFKPDWSSSNSATLAGQNQWLFFLDVDNWSLSVIIVTNGFSFIQLSTGSNQFQNPWTFKNGAINGQVVNFQSNLWYQMVLTYSPTNITIYTNGVLLATANWLYNSNGDFDYSAGYGDVYYPPASALSTFAFGSTGGGQPILGQLDGLQTFNYPLTGQQVASLFPTFSGAASNNMIDTYYVGRSDMLQTYVDGVFPPVSNSAAPCRLGYWRFDSDLLISEEGQVPISANDVSLVPSWSGTALNISSASASQVTYWDVYSNGWANINCRQGSLRFWYKPNSASVPGHAAPFVYMGNPSGTDKWSLEQSSDGSSILFVTATNGMAMTNLSTNYTFSTTNWTQIVLDYGSNSSTLYINGTPVATGSPVSYYPSLANRQLGMVIGNSTAYNSPINGQFDEMETFNYQLASSDVSSNFGIVQAVDSDLDGIPDLLEDIHLPTARPFLGAPVVVAGTVEAEQFDMGGPGVGYYTPYSNSPSSYRPTGMFITNCNDLGLGYCLDQTHAGEWVQYAINVIVPETYAIETRVAGIGTNGVFECEFTNTGFYTNTGPLTITTTNWTNLSAMVYLPAGTNIMKLHFLTNGTDGAHVGRFNYISVYAGWNPGFTSTYTNFVTGLNTNNDFIDASNNAVIIQSNVNAVGASGGGTVLLPAGTYYVSQSAPNETNVAWQNSAVLILTNNIEIAGAGKTNTTLIAFNRATTIFGLGRASNYTGYQCTNVTFRDMTIEAQPHLAVSNVTNTTFELGQLAPPLPYNYYTGTLTFFVGDSYTQLAQNILITNCQFLYGDSCLTVIGAVSNLLVTHCDFTIWSGTNFYTGATNNSPTNTPNTQGYGGSVGIFGAGSPSYNINVLENTYQGNANLVPSTNNPYGYVTTNGSGLTAPDGFVYFQSGGNFFVARNAITNNALEGVQLAGAPSSVVGNTYYTLVSDGACCALANGGSGFGALTGTNLINYSTCFIGNQVYGGRWGTSPQGEGSIPLYALNVSGNYLTLYPPFPQNDAPGAVAGPQNCSWVNVFGNTLVSGGYGVFFSECGNARVMNNNFANVTFCGIGISIDEGWAQTADIFNNVVGQGSTFHVQLPFEYSFGWFLNQNEYLNSSSNSVPPFLDPAASAVHVN